MINRVRHYHLGCGENLQSAYMELWSGEREQLQERKPREKRTARGKPKGRPH
jgi:hypothetical protein